MAFMAAPMCSGRLAITRSMEEVVLAVWLSKWGSTYWANSS